MTGGGTGAERDRGDVSKGGGPVAGLVFPATGLAVLLERTVQAVGSSGDEIAAVSGWACRETRSERSVGALVVAAVVVVVVAGWDRC